MAAAGSGEKAKATEFSEEISSSPYQNKLIKMYSTKGVGGVERSAGGLDGAYGSITQLNRHKSSAEIMKGPSADNSDIIIQ